MKKPTTETVIIAPIAEKEHRASRRVKILRPLLARPSRSETPGGGSTDHAERFPRRPDLQDPGKALLRWDAR